MFIVADLVSLMPSIKNCKNGSAVPNKRPTRALDKKYLKTTSPEPLIEMKKVNKQCLLDTPRTVRVSEKTWQVIVQTSRPLFLKEYLCRICANKNYKLLHAYVQCVYIVSAKYQIAPSKAVVGFDQPIKALSMYIQKPYKGIIV